MYVYTDTSQGILSHAVHIPCIEDTLVTTLQIHLFQIHDDAFNISFLFHLKGQ